MTALVARQPLHPLSMSSSQRGPRRLSSRLQEKDEAADIAPPSRSSKPDTETAKAQGPVTANKKKRKNDHDEEDDGFTFSRVKKRKSRISETKQQNAPEAEREERAPEQQITTQKIPVTNGDSTDPPKRRRNKMSFSTPDPREMKPVRRSKRLSNENDERDGSPLPKTHQKTQQAQVEDRSLTQKLPVQKRKREGNINDQSTSSEKLTERTVEEHSGTKIALPFADTPVIRRNKAMREDKSGKGERRSSLGIRGRRASSLIESGNSNALPHSEVANADFYKHIESEGLPEPRRMRQLLTWCATRALDQKPMGTGFEDASARSAARVIEEELLKDLANRSELSDWFTREDEPVQPKSLPERPNPKNVQNAEKITELEEQIKTLRAEMDSLESLLRTPAVLQMPEANACKTSKIDKMLLSEADAALLDSLNAGNNLASDVSQRLNTLQSSLGPTIDAFADGIHKIAQYRKAADNVAGRVLAICSDKLAEREREGRRKALQQEEDRSPRRDLNSVLRGLSRVDR